jgi:poly-gamma-glutamate synthesis protein (capsule biosynthesis protein)
MAVIDQPCLCDSCAGRAAGDGSVKAGILSRAKDPRFMTASNEIGLILCGDVMLGRGIDQILPHPGDPALYEDWRGVVSARTYVELAERENGPLPGQRGIEYVWGDALAIFDELGADLRLINLETAVTARGQPWPGKGIHYRMHPGNAGVLECAGIHACALANNHTLDWGHEGLADTLAALAQAKSMPGGRRNGRPGSVRSRHSAGGRKRTGSSLFAGYRLERRPLGVDRGSRQAGHQSDRAG